MAKKKRAKKKIKKAKPSKISKPLAKPKEELQVPQTSKFARALTTIAAAILGLYGILVLAFPSSIISWLVENLGPNTTLTQGALITHGVCWVILSVLIFLSNKEIRKTADKSWMWFLLVLSIASIILFIGKPIGAAAVFAGVLILIASIIHLSRK